jgi:hypothetical protein
VNTLEMGDMFLYKPRCVELSSFLDPTYDIFFDDVVQLE